MFTQGEVCPLLKDLLQAAIRISSIQRTCLISTIMYLSMHNDVSFLIADEMSLYEQQSTYNPNMPLRMLQYLASLYEKHIKQTRQNKFGKTKLTLPAPRLVVFYNGLDSKPDEMTLRLSDLFPPDTPYDVEVSVRMININMGKNETLLSNCKTLGEYAWLVERVRREIVAIEVDDENDVESAVDRAIDAVPDDFEIKGFLTAHKAEVKDMLLTEYNEATTMELFKQEGRAEGIFDSYAGLVRDGLLNTNVAATRLGLTEPEFRARYASWAPTKS